MPTGATSDIPTKAVMRALDAELAARVRCVCARYPMLQRLYLFGSRARDEATTESDYDLYAEIDYNLMVWTDYYDLIQQLEGALNSSVDFVSGTTLPQRSPVLWREIQRDKVLIYERKEK